MTKKEYFNIGKRANPGENRKDIEEIAQYFEDHEKIKFRYGVIGM